MNRYSKQKGVQMENYAKLSHTTYECKYHIVFISKYRKKTMYQNLRIYLGEIFHDLARQKGCKIEEGHLMSDHVHILITIPPKYPVSSIVGYLKGKSAIAIARNFMGKKRNFTGMKFWARGYFVSTVGRDEKTIREYIKNQEEEDKKFEQLTIFDD